MRSKLFWLGNLLAAMAAVLGLVSSNTDARGIPDANPIGAIAIGVAALAFLYASTVTPDRSSAGQSRPMV